MREASPLDDTAIVAYVSGATKKYDVYARPADMLVEMLTRRSRHSQFTAMEDVSFTLRRGEILGIVGRNGAGKSTLLKVLAGTLEPSSGIVELRGRVAAILELGTGFHPEYSGRENIRLGGLCLGMTSAEIDAKLESIIEFSGINDAIDNLFKTYSSGMQARLTFSLAIHQDADILIIDEALAAGDGIFVAKCLRKLQDICASGRTVIFVSHGLELVERFCTRAIWMERGRVVLDADVHTACRAYQRFVWEQDASYLHSSSNGDSNVRASDLLSTSADVNGSRVADAGFFRYGSKIMEIKSFVVTNEQGAEAWTIETGSRVEFRYAVSTHGKAVEDVRIACQIFTATGVLVFTPESSPMRFDGDFSAKIVIPNLPLGTGTYLLSPSVLSSGPAGEVYHDFHDRTYQIRVNSRQSKYQYIVEFPFETVADDSLPKDTH